MTKMSDSTDLRNNPVYLDRQIRHISDADLFAAMDLDRPDLKEVKAAVSQADYPAAYRAWVRYWVSRPGFAYLRRPGQRGESGQARPEGDQGRNTWAPFSAVEEARKALAGDTSSIAAADQVVAHNIRGWGNVTIQHGPVVDFNADYGQAGKSGFNYWGWSTPLLWASLGGGSRSSRAPIDWVAFDRSPSAGRTDDLAVLLYPFKTSSPPSVSIRRAGSNGLSGTAYLIVEGRGTTDHIVISDGQARAFGGGAIQTDARCALVRVASDHPRITYALVGGTRLVFQGKPIFQTSAPTDAEGEASP